MEFPSDLLYTKDHEWAKVQGDVVTVGITEHAQSSLGDIVFVELPKVGRVLKGHETFGVVESIKAVSDLYSPIAGTVLEVNSKAVEDPGVLNRAPHTDGWLMRVKIADTGALTGLLSPADYKSYVDSL